MACANHPTAAEAYLWVCRLAQQLQGVVLAMTGVLDVLNTGTAAARAAAGPHPSLSPCPSQMLLTGSAETLTRWPGCPRAGRADVWTQYLH